MAKKPIEYDDSNQVPYTVVQTGLKPPSSNWSDIRCGACGTVSRAYWWSLSGGGKKCRGCGGKHNSSGTTSPIKKGK